MVIGMVMKQNKSYATSTRPPLATTHPQIMNLAETSPTALNDIGKNFARK